MKVDIFNTENKYQIIYADPAWSYRDRALAGDRGKEDLITGSSIFFSKSRCKK